MNKIKLIFGLFLILLLSSPIQAYTINEPLKEKSFNYWELNITFASITERDNIYAKISNEKVVNIVDLSYVKVNTLTYIVSARLKEYSTKINKLCANCSSWYLNSSWETIEVYNVTNTCLNCVVNYTGTYNKSDRWINVSNYTDLPHWNESSTKVWINLTGNETQIGKAVNSSNFYDSASNGTNTFIQWHGTATATYVDSAKTPSSNFIYESQISVSATHDMKFGIDSGAYPTNGLYIFPNSGGNEKYGLAFDGGVLQGQVVTTPAISAGTHTLKITRFGTVAHFYVDTVEIETGLSGISFPAVQMGLAMKIAVGTVTQSYSFTRKYASPEPTLTYYSTEYYYPTPPTPPYKMNLTDIRTACKIVNNAFSGDCSFVYGTDYIIVLLTIIVSCLVFMIIFIIYKETVK